MSGVDFIKKNEDYLQDTYSLVLDQFKGSENYIKIVNVISSAMQDYENLLVDMAEGMLFQNAVGEQLTEIGRQLDVVRRTDNDDDFRAVLALTAVRRSNDGTRDKLYDLLSEYSAKDIEFIIGADEQLDINLFAACIADIHGVQALIDLLPINTYYRVVDVEGTPFGFDDDDGGFAGTEDDTDAGIGNMSSLIAQVEE